nr:MAG TPA: hypothetical protein [Caudoviricetes sp.]
MTSFIFSSGYFTYPSETYPPERLRLYFCLLISLI